MVHLSIKHQHQQHPDNNTRLNISRQSSFFLKSRSTDKKKTVGRCPDRQGSGPLKFNISGTFCSKMSNLNMNN